MRKVRLALCAVLMAGCTGSARQPATPTVGPTSPGRFSPPSPVVLPPVILQADLSEPPSGWKQVAFIPFGEEREALGFMTFRESPNSVPSALAIGPDGTFWIADRWKRRVVHYSSAGEFIGEAGPMRSPGWDIAVHDGQVYVLETQAKGLVGTVSGDNVIESELTFQGDPLFTFQIVSTEVGLVAQSVEVPGAPPTDLGSFILLEVPGPRANELLPGLPLGDGGAAVDARYSDERAHPDGDQDFDLTFLSSEIAQIQPLQIELIGRDRGQNKSIPAEVGLTEPIPMGGDVIFLVKAAPTRPDDAEKFGGGRWLLRMGESPILWERLPYPRIAEEFQHRHLAAGPDGALYLMLAGRRGEVILRRAPAGG